MIKLYNITKSYKDAVLKNINYEFCNGKIYVIKGVSGCGKSTLLNILGGLDTDFEGEYQFNGENVGRVDKRVGIIFQKLEMDNFISSVKYAGYIAFFADGFCRFFAEIRS